MRAADVKRLRIPSKGGTYHCKAWLVLYDGGSDTWLYVCRDSLAYIFLELTDLEAWGGRETTKLWSARVCVVDLLTTSEETTVAALRSCGTVESPRDLDFKEELDRLHIAESLFSYGAHAPMWHEEAGKVKSLYESPGEHSPSFRSLRKRARVYAEENLFEEEGRRHLMDTLVVNPLGQTANEYAQGVSGTWEALRRIKELGDKATPKQRLTLKLYSICERTLDGTPIPEDLRSKP